MARDAVQEPRSSAAVRWSGPPSTLRGNLDDDFVTLYQLAGQGVGVVPRPFAEASVLVVFDGFLGTILRRVAGYLGDTERHVLRLGMPVYRARMATLGERLPGTAPESSGIARNVDYALTQIHRLIERHPDRNLVLYGHSLGGTVLLYCLDELADLPVRTRERIFVIADQAPDESVPLARLITTRPQLRRVVAAALAGLGGSIDVLDDAARLGRIHVPPAMAPRVLRRGTHLDSAITVFVATRLLNRRLGATRNDGWLPTAACIDDTTTHVTRPGSDHFSPSWAGRRGDGVTEGQLIEAMIAVVAGVEPARARPSPGQRRSARLERVGRNLTGRQAGRPSLAEVGAEGTTSAGARPEILDTGR